MNIFEQHLQSVIANIKAIESESHPLKLKSNRIVIPLIVVVTLFAIGFASYIIYRINGLRHLSSYRDYQYLEVKFEIPEEFSTICDDKPNGTTFHINIINCDSDEERMKARLAINIRSTQVFPNPDLTEFFAEQYIISPIDTIEHPPAKLPENLSDTINTIEFYIIHKPDPEEKLYQHVVIFKQLGGRTIYTFSIISDKNFESQSKEIVDHFRKTIQIAPLPEPVQRQYEEIKFIRPQNSLFPFNITVSLPQDSFITCLNNSCGDVTAAINGSFIAFRYSKYPSYNDIQNYFLNYKIDRSYVHIGEHDAVLLPNFKPQNEMSFVTDPLGIVEKTHTAILRIDNSYDVISMALYSMDNTGQIYTPRQLDIENFYHALDTVRFTQ